MTRSRTRATVAGLVVIALLMTAAIGLQRARDAAYPLPVISDSTLYFTSAAALGRMSLGFRALTADLYWIRTLQYFGDIQRGHRIAPTPGGGAGEEDYQALYPLLDLTTSLDPWFNIAYRFGAIFLSEPPPAGPGRPDLAIRLLEKGLAVRPDKWEYMQDIGFVHYWWRHDYKAAADAFLRAAAIPGAPWWLKSLSATTLAQGGDRQSSRTMWTAIHQSAEVDFLKRDAERRLAQLDALDAIDTLQRVVDRYRQRSGAPPADWTAMVRAGAIQGIPLDPAGTPFEITPEGRVQLTYRSPLWPLPEEPRSLDRPRP